MEKNKIDGGTDGPTNKAGCRVACTRYKVVSNSIAQFVYEKRFSKVDAYYQMSVYLIIFFLGQG